MTDVARVRQPGRPLRRVAIVMAAMLLAGCQTVLPRGATEPGRRPPPPRQQPTQVEPGIPTDTARHRVALLVPLSGPNAGVGQSLANATQMALLDSNNQRIRITTYDTNLGAAAAAQKAIADGNRLSSGRCSVTTCARSPRSRTARRCRWWRSRTMPRRRGRVRI